MNLAVELAPGRKQGLRLANPVMPASGTFSNGLEFAKVFDINRLGAIVSKSMTPQARRGNRQPRIAETPAGMLNSIGLQNTGVEAVLRDLAPVWATWQVPVIANIAADTIGDYAHLARRLEGAPGVAAIEVNISCPNVEVGGLEFGSDPAMAAQVTAAVVAETSLPVIVKLTPNVTDIREVARAVVAAGADALTLINTLLGMAIDVRTRRPIIARAVGGLSGPAIKPIGLRMVYQVAGVVDVPIIGCGGISTATDALEYLMAGATAIQVGTATFGNPLAPLDVLEGIEGWMEREGLTSITQVVGAARFAP
jgi:dihydroorotate dehydrogenase (NAD+) catalytic subunit